MLLNEHSGRLTQFVRGNQQYEFKRILYGISIGPASFSAVMSKTLSSLILSKNIIIYLDDDFIQSLTKQEMFKVLDEYHEMLIKETMKAASDKSHFFLTRVKLFGHIIEVTKIIPSKSRIDVIL